MPVGGDLVQHFLETNQGNGQGAFRRRVRPGCSAQRTGVDAAAPEEALDACVGVLQIGCGCCPRRESIRSQSKT